MLRSSVMGPLLDLVLPLLCVGCGRPGSVWCAGCQPPPTLLTRTVGDLFVLSAGEYDGELRTALLSFKERGVRALAPPLATYLAAAVHGHAVVREAGARPVVFAPIPSRRRAARERGGDHLLRLLRCRHVWARQTGPAPRVVRPLNLLGRVRDSAGLAVEERRKNLDGRMIAREPPPAHLASSVVLVDDIVTTGATLREATRALSAAGWHVAGAATIAATPRRLPASRSP